jgi:beta-glucanase (GH16 family)
MKELLKEIPPPAWRLLKSDDFNGAELDRAMWSLCKEGPSAWNRHMADRHELVEVKNGLLVLKGVRTPPDFNDRRPYLTGGIHSSGKFARRYGKVEIRARFHDQKGAWPAFWMMPEHSDPLLWKNPPEGGLTWPDCGEIDIVERLNADPFVYQTVHSKWIDTLGHGDAPPHSSGPHPKIVTDAGGFCIYGVEWTEDEIVWTINGVATHRYAKCSDDPARWPWTKPFYLILDMQLGGSWAGEVDISTLPVTCEIDWIRIFEPAS